MPKYPKKKLAQLVLQACVQHGIEQVVISPGSRNAPLTLGFVNHPKIETFSIIDERCAGFFAMGLAQQSKKTVALLCTSGSAMLNYYPAVAEAFYSKIGLLVLSADRPKHLIDVGDGQTIRQDDVYNNHVAYQTDLMGNAHSSSPEDQGFALKKNAEELARALGAARFKSGPVHINVPFDEPLYETTEQLYDFSQLKLKQRPKQKDSLLDEVPLEVEDLQQFATLWNSSERKMVLIGSHDPDELIQLQMNRLLKDPSVIVLTETTSNVKHEQFVNHIDQLIFPMEPEEFESFRPDILISFGGMVVSKKIKQLIRQFPPAHHWHIDAHRPLDTFQCLTRHFEVSPQLFFSQFFFLTGSGHGGYKKLWLGLKQTRKLRHRDFLKELEFSDLKVFEIVLRSLPKSIHLQVGNSSIIRYTQLFDVDQTIDVFCNRGTSGIDGCTSTSIGAAVAREEQTVLITGDISFFYDSNALWNNYIPDNFRIILVNNGGGGIFKFIPGPASTGAIDYFETSHQLNAAALCGMYGLEYAAANDGTQLKKVLEDFYVHTGKPALLEIFTPEKINALLLKEYFQKLR